MLIRAYREGGVAGCRADELASAVLVVAEAAGDVPQSYALNGQDQRRPWDPERFGIEALTQRALFVEIFVSSADERGRTERAGALDTGRGGAGLLSLLWRVRGQARPELRSPAAAFWSSVEIVEEPAE